MKNSKSILLSVLMALTVTLFFAADALGQNGNRAARPTELFKGRKVVAGEVLVKFRPAATPAAISQAKRNADAEHDRKVGGTGLRLLRSRSKDVASLIAELNARTDVLYAEPNLVINTTDVPDDARFAELWGLQNTGQAVGGVQGVFEADIGAAGAWDVTTGSRANVVAVVDTGIEYAHPDLAANIWAAPAAFTVNIGGQLIQCAAGTHGFNAISKTCDPADVYGHGTHVAGTIGAAGGNGVGVAGVNHTASIMGLKFMGATGSGSLADAIDALEFAVQVKQIFGTEANVRVLNNSWGWNGEPSQALLDQINRTDAAEMLFVASAGNGGADRLGDDNDVSPFYPSNYTAPNVVSVAATNNRDGLSSFSNYGRNSVHLGAPGENILSTVMGGGYEAWSGTSMAAPHVSGAAALLLSRCALGTAALKNSLLNNADPIVALDGLTVSGGRLNVNSALGACTGEASGLSLTQSDSPDPLRANAELTYTLTVTNVSSNAAATNITLTDTLPAGVTFISATASQGACGGTGTITCALGGLAPKAQAVVRLVVKPSAPGVITNTAAVTGDEADSDPGDNTATATTTVRGSLASLVLNPTSVTGAKVSVATVTLDVPAPAGGAVVKLLSSDAAVAYVPAAVTVAAGTTSKNFNVTSRAVAAPSSVEITATYDGSARSATVTVQPPALSSFTLSPVTINSPCQTSAGKVILNAPAPAGGAVVALASSNPSAQVPAGVTVPAGTTWASFTVTPSVVSVKQAATITASFRGVNLSKTLTLMPVAVATLALTPNPVTGPANVTGTVTLTCAAPQGGIVVKLTTSSTAVALPVVSSITIPAGAQTGTFGVTTADVTTAKSVSITAAAGGVSKVVSLKVN